MTTKIQIIIGLPDGYHHNVTLPAEAFRAICEAGKIWTDYGSSERAWTETLLLLLGPAPTDGGQPKPCAPVPKDWPLEPF